MVFLAGNLFRDLASDNLSGLNSTLLLLTTFPADTVSLNIIKAIDSDALIEALHPWINHRRISEGKNVIVIDGKT